LRHREGKGERGQGEVEAGEPRQDTPEQVSGDQAHERGGEDSRVGGHTPMAHHHRQGVRTQPVERAMSKRDQPRLARDQVEAEDGDRVRCGKGKLVGPEAPQQERERNRAHGEQYDGEAARIHGVGRLIVPLSARYQARA
jgi:hypothetical protein